MSFKFLDRIHKKPLDTSRKESVFRLYDEERGYRQYHEYCQSLCTRNHWQTENAKLLKTGVEHVSILDASMATHALTSILEKVDETKRKEHIDYSEILHIGDHEFINSLLSRIFSPSLDDKLLQFFRSEYVVYWFTILRAVPSTNSRRSFLWHCDKGPSSHLKILLYLNGTEDHGGNTEFLDREVTERFTETGYLFGPVEARQDDLSDLAKDLSIDYSPQKWEIRPGEGIIFEPSKVLHRGILPTKGPRYVIALCLLPSPIPWQEAFQLTHGIISPDYTWHESAETILQTLVKK